MICAYLSMSYMGLNFMFTYGIHITKEKEFTYLILSIVYYYKVNVWTSVFKLLILTFGPGLQLIDIFN